MTALTLMHLIVLHDSVNSGNPLSISDNYNKLPFTPYFIFKDLIILFIFILILILSIFIFFISNLLGDNKKYIIVNII